jgi:hypothetical protein
MKDDVSVPFWQARAEMLDRRTRALEDQIIQQAVQHKQFADHLRAENQKLLEQSQDVERWEIGFRNIVSILIGPSTTFEIKDVVEMVRNLKACAAETDSGAFPCCPDCGYVLACSGICVI